MENNHINISDEMIAAFLDGEASSEEIKTIFSQLSNDRELSESLALSITVDDEIESKKQTILPIGALAAANSENLCSFECELFILHHLDFDIDHWSLLETAKANKWLREEGTPLHHVGRLLELKGFRVARRYDTTLEELETAINSGEQVMVIIDNTLLEGKDDTNGSAYHAIYVTEVEEDYINYLNLETLLEETIASEDFLKVWKASGNYMVKASIVDNNYNPQPIDVEDIVLDYDLEELTEAIAENAHDIWARTRMDEGWKYGPMRNDETKEHPDLVPYAMLPDSEKEYDRLMAMNTLRLVRRLGFDIVNRVKK